TLATSSGQITNAVYGFTSMLTNLLRDEQPTHLAVAFDAGRVTFRTERYPEYKGTRDATPDAFRGQVPLIKEVLDALRIPFVQLEGIEADDILATLAPQARAADMDVLPGPGDRDALQLSTGTSRCCTRRRACRSSRAWTRRRSRPSTACRPSGTPTS